LVVGGERREEKGTEVRSLRLEISLTMSD